MKRYEHLLRISSVLFMVFACPSVHAGPAHVALRAELNMQSDTVLLVDLLPDQAPDELRRSVAGISLGSAPRPGTDRRLSRTAVVDALSANGISATMFDVPESIRVRRIGRELTSAEVWSAIQKSLTNTPGQAMSVLKPEDIRFDSSIVVPPAGARLMLSQVRYDPLLGEARFRIVPSGTNFMLPFYVTAKMKPAALTRSSEVNGFTRPLDEFTSAPILVQPKTPATLRLHSANSETKLRVQPLIPGHLGEVIPVRLLGNRKTLKGRVVDFGLLDAAF
jgi:hypothetical protein